jgi:hypothetical protein
MLEQRDWCEDLEMLPAYGTVRGLHCRCRRCGRVFRQYGFASLKIGPCIADRYPCVETD